MKTYLRNTGTGHILTGLTTVLFAVAVQADDVGVVRLGQGASPASQDSSVVRGQSAYRQRNATTSRALAEFFTGSRQPVTQASASSHAANACDGGNICCPMAPVPAACDSTEPCCPTSPGDCDGVSCVPGMATDCNATCDSGCDSAWTAACDGDGHDVCRRCQGAGCRHCQDDDVYRATGGLFNRGTHCPHGYQGTGCPVCDGHACVNDNCVAHWLGDQAAMHRARKRVANAGLNRYLRCKLGYLIHDGCGGVGCYPFGHYQVVYPVDPNYAEARDGQVYAAQGFGGPVSVPLAPNVRHTYNYGWGIPSSRLTPIGNPVPTGY
jgi:hypothetical protein